MFLCSPSRFIESAWARRAEAIRQQSRQCAPATHHARARPAHWQMREFMRYTRSVTHRSRAPLFVASGSFFASGSINVCAWLCSFESQKHARLNGDRRPCPYRLWMIVAERHLLVFYSIRIKCKRTQCYLCVCLYCNMVTFYNVLRVLSFVGEQHHFYAPAPESYYVLVCCIWCDAGLY